MSTRPLKSIALVLAIVVLAVASFGSFALATQQRPATAQPTAAAWDAGAGR